MFFYILLQGTSGGLAGDHWEQVSRTTSSSEIEKSEITSEKRMRHTIVDLEPATEYETLLSVKNKFGSSQTSESFIFHTRRGKYNFHFNDEKF